MLTFTWVQDMDDISLLVEALDESWAKSYELREKYQFGGLEHGSGIAHPRNTKWAVNL